MSAEQGQDPDRCPDCGHPIPAHFAAGEFRGCPTRWQALAFGGTPRVCIRTWARGIRVGEAVVVWPDHMQGGEVLIWDPGADTWSTLATDRVSWVTRRADRGVVERVKDDVEHAIQGPVRVISKVTPRRRGGGENDGD